MSATTYRMMVLGGILSAFLLGMHMPVLHEIADHGAGASMPGVIATAALAVLTFVFAWKLLGYRR